MCEGHSHEQPDWMLKMMMILYQGQVNDTLDFYITLGRMGQMPLLGGVVKYVAGCYGRLMHGGRAATIEECMEVLSRAGQIKVIDCACRTKSDNCKKPLRTCILVNTGAEVIGSLKNGVSISALEAERILLQGREHGLIPNLTHCTNPGLYAICSCCTCCCVPYRLRFSYGIKSAMDNGSKAARVDKSRCTGCNRCGLICPGQAVSAETEQILAPACLGCGLCAGVCPAGAIEMVCRGTGHRPAPPGKIKKAMLYAAFTCVVLPLAGVFKAARIVKQNMFMKKPKARKP